MLQHHCTSIDVHPKLTVNRIAPICHRAFPTKIVRAKLQKLDETVFKVIP